VSEYYADDRVVATHYDGIKAFMDSQTAQLDPDGVLSFARCKYRRSGAPSFAHRARLFPDIPHLSPSFLQTATGAASQTARARA